MAHLEKLWVCPGCHVKWSTQREANKCAISHVHCEQWAVSDKYRGKAVKCNYRGTEWALREADTPDFPDQPETALRLLPIQKEEST